MQRYGEIIPVMGAEDSSSSSKCLHKKCAAKKLAAHGSSESVAEANAQQLGLFDDGGVRVHHLQLAGHLLQGTLTISRFL